MPCLCSANGEPCLSNAGELGWDEKQRSEVQIEQHPAEAPHRSHVGDKYTYMNLQIAAASQ